MMVVAAGVFVYLTRNFWLGQLRAYALGSEIIAAENYTRHLPEVDRLDGFFLWDPPPGAVLDTFPGLGDERYPIVARVERTGPEAQRFARAWRDLPCGLSPTCGALCHEPRYGLRFYQHQRLVYATSFCWHCGNFTVPVLLFHTTYPFDRKEPRAHELLTQLQAVFPNLSPGPKWGGAGLLLDGHLHGFASVP